MSEAAEAFLLYEQSGHVVTLTMNQPETRNALTGNSAIPEFIDACARINADLSVRAVILTGAGGVFCSGGNIKDMRRHLGADYTVDDIRDEYRQGIQQLALGVYQLEVPCIAAVNGAAIGAGCDLTCMCDIRLASETASFAESFVRLGLIAGDGGAWLLPRVVGWSRAAEMTYTGASMSASEALACGLISKMVSAATLLPAAHALAARIAENPGTALRMSKRLMREAQHLRLPELLEMAAAMQALAVKTPQHAEAVQAFIQKRPPRFSN